MTNFYFNQLEEVNSWLADELHELFPVDACGNGHDAQWLEEGWKTLCGYGLLTHRHAGIDLAMQHNGYSPEEIASKNASEIFLVQEFAQVFTRVPRCEWDNVIDVLANQAPALWPDVICAPGDWPGKKTWRDSEVENKFGTPRTVPPVADLLEFQERRRIPSTVGYLHVRELMDKGDLNVELTLDSLVNVIAMVSTDFLPWNHEVRRYNTFRGDDGAYGQPLEYTPTLDWDRIRERCERMEPGSFMLQTPMEDIRNVVGTAMELTRQALYDERGNSRIAHLPFEKRRDAFVKAVTPLYTTVNAVHPTKMYCSAGVRAFVTGLARQHGLDMNWGLEGTTSGQRRDANIAALHDNNLEPMQELLKGVCREPGSPDISEGLKATQARVKRLALKAQP